MCYRETFSFPYYFTDMQTEAGITKNLTLSVLRRAPQHSSNRAEKLSGEHSAITSALVVVGMVTSSWGYEVTLKIPSWRAFLVVLFRVISSGTRSHSGMWTSVSFDLMCPFSELYGQSWACSGLEKVQRWMLRWSWTGASPPFWIKLFVLAKCAHSFLCSGKSKLRVSGPARTS